MPRIAGCRVDGDILLELSAVRRSSASIQHIARRSCAGVQLRDFRVGGALFGLVPAIQTARHAMADTLKAEAGSLSSGGGQVRLRKGLVVAQISLSLMLLIGAGLFARSLFNLRSMHPGFTTENLLTFSIQPSLSGYQETRRLSTSSRGRFQRLQSIPGVRLVSASDTPLMTQDRNMYTVKVEGYTPKEREDMNFDIDMVAPSFFSTIGVPVLAGREFTSADRRRSAGMRDQ